MYHHLLELRYQKERRHLFPTVTTWGFAMGLIQIFIPIFLWKNNFSLSQIFLFFAIQYTARLLSTPFSIISSGKIGAKHSLSLSFIFPVLFFLTFSQIPDVPYYFFAAAIFIGVSKGYGWPAYHMHVSKITPDVHRGKTLALVTILRTIALAAAPAVGGYIIENFGVSKLVLVAIFLLILSAMLLMNTKEVFSRHKLNRKLLRFRHVARDSVANGFFNTKVGMNLVAWPLFMYTILPGFKKIGYIEGAAIAISSVALYYLGNLLDRGERKRFLVWTSVLYVPVAIVRLLAFNPISLIIFHVIYQLFDRANGLVWVSIQPGIPLFFLPALKD